MATSPLANHANPIAVPLQQLWADNFVVYFKAHGYHFNVQGPTFSQDHALMSEIYTYLHDQHDVLGELIRQLDKPVLPSLERLLDASSISEATPSVKDSKAMFGDVCGDLEELLESAHALYSRCEEFAGHETVIGDYCAAVSKLVWKCKATLGRSIK